MTRIRKKGIAIVETRKGILVVSGNNKKIFGLPGGGADKGESRRRAASRELREETGLKTKSSKFFIEYMGAHWKDYKGKIVKNHVKVFIVNAYGSARPRHEVKRIAYWKPGSKITISHSAQTLINKYREYKNESN